MPGGLRSPTPNPAQVLVSPGVPLPDPPVEERRKPPRGLSSGQGEHSLPTRAQDHSWCWVSRESRLHRKEWLTASAWVPEASARLTWDPSQLPVTSLLSIAAMWVQILCDFGQASSPL